MFDHLAPSYEEWYRSRLGRFADAVEWRILLDLLRPKPAERILDIGSGTGRNVRRLAKRGVRAVGLEPSAAMLAEAQGHRAKDQPSYVRGVAEALPFAGDVLDAALAVTTLEFVTDWRQPSPRPRGWSSREEGWSSAFLTAGAPGLRGGGNVEVSPGSLPAFSLGRRSRLF